MGQFEGSIEFVETFAYIVRENLLGKFSDRRWIDVVGENFETAADELVAGWKREYRVEFSVVPKVDVGLREIYRKKSEKIKLSEFINFFEKFNENFEGDFLA